MNILIKRVLDNKTRKPINILDILDQDLINITQSIIKKASESLNGADGECLKKSFIVKNGPSKALEYSRSHSLGDNIEDYSDEYFSLLVITSRWVWDNI